MLRSAEEILMENYNGLTFNEAKECFTKNDIVDIINQARSEAIKECYNRASKLWGVGKKTGESILNLIKQLK